MSVPKKELSPTEIQQLERTQAQIEKLEGQLLAARTAWARMVQGFVVASVARHLGVSRQALDSRIKTIAVQAVKAMPWVRGGK